LGKLQFIEPARRALVPWILLLLLMLGVLLAPITGIGGGAAGGFLIRLPAARLRRDFGTGSDGVGSVPGALKRAGKRIQILAQRSLEGRVGRPHRDLNLTGALRYVQVDRGRFGLGNANGDVLD
jgi:hypothetical protein